MPGKDGQEYATPLVVGVGASAGGLEALERFFASVRRGLGAAFVVVQHLSPDHKSLMVELLTRHAHLDVRPADHGTTIVEDTVYVLQPRTAVTTDGQRLLIQAREHGLPGRLPIDEFFESLAAACGTRCAAVVLSGTGSDGTRGVRGVADAGGLVLVQSPESARFDGMPRAAIATGAVDDVGTPAELAERLARYCQRRGQEIEIDPSVVEGALADVLGSVHRATAVDFTKYKPATIQRRLARRMALRGVNRIEDYLPLVRNDAEEARALGQDFLIHVTRFFRDGEVWGALERAVVPGLLKRAARQGLRCWVVGCATGEEAYSVAMLVREAQHAEDEQRGGEVKIFATDVDRGAIDRAALGLYSHDELGGVSSERRARHFEPHGEGYRVCREVRRMVVFAVHDVLADPPFGRLDLILCRNLLIYLDIEAQRRLLGAFLYGLRPEGVLVLGASENLGTWNESFVPVQGETKIFSVAEGARGARSPALVGARVDALPRQALAPRVELGYQRLIDLYAPPSVLVNDAGQVVHSYGAVAALLSVPSGAPTLDLLAMVPADARGVLNVAIQRAVRDERESAFEGVGWSGPRGAKVVSLRVVPVRDRVLARAFALVCMAEELGAARAAPGPTATSPMQALQDELVITRENLQATVEELETSNEELQATNEEMLAANEELQSTNEELQSVNEELHTVNSELQEKVQELLDANDDIDNLLRQSRVGMLFLDEELRVRRYTPTVTRHVPLRATDVGRPVDEIAASPAGVDLVSAARGVFVSGARFEHTFDDPEGSTWSLSVSPYEARDIRRRGVILTFLDVTAERRARRHLVAILDSLAHSVVVLDRHGVITLVNAAWREFGRSNGGDPAASAEGADYLAVCDAAGDDPVARVVAHQLRDLLARRTSTFQLEYPCDAPATRRRFRLYAAALRGEGGGAVLSHLELPVDASAAPGQWGGAA